MVKLSALQLCSLPDVDENLAQIDQLLSSVTQADTHIVVLPECCLFFGGRDSDQLELAKQTPPQQLTQRLAAIAKKHQCYLVAGTIPLLTDKGDKFTNSSCVFSPMGELLARYDKIHLFDVEVDDSEKSYFESKYTQAGKATAIATIADINLGLSVCYDVRFPELYRQLAQLGANVITVPAAFTRVTGRAHWLPLLQARAIENQVYIVAAAQEGIHQNGRETWGHSMIINPWGEVLTTIEHGVGIISAEFLPDEQLKIQASMPVHQHNQFTLKLKSYE